MKQPKDETPVAKKARFTVYESPKLKLDNFFVRLPKRQAPSVEAIPMTISDSTVEIEHITPNIQSNPLNLVKERSERDRSAASTSAMSLQEILMDGKFNVKIAS